MRFLPLVLMLALSACGTATIGAVAPRPTINLAPSNQHLALALSPGIPDVFDVPCGSETQVCTLHVTGFHTSLENGYAASFRRYYALAGDRADLTLRFESLSIELIPGSGGQMVVHFAAHLDDREGKTLGRSFGSVKPGRQAAETALTEGLALVFEKVAADCFVPPSSAH